MGLRVNWRVVAASAVGTSHVTSGKPCEDSCWAQADITADKQPILSIFVADGAGSAEFGGEGAEIAMKTAADFIAGKIIEGEFGINDELAVQCIRAIRQSIESWAIADGKRPRDFACTLLGVVSLPHATLTMQIGDGGIVFQADKELELAIVPMTGEYANMTHFVTDENAIEVLCTRVINEPLSKVAVFSDGIQRLALNMIDNTPHTPFFSPFFKTLESTRSEQEDELHSALFKFLNSQAVNCRTDDDKTLALAVFIK